MSPEPIVYINEHRRKVESTLDPHILFEDQHLIVISKPSGLLSQGAKPDEPNLVDWLRNYLGRPYVGLIHRLDRETSGLMVIAKRTKSAQRLTEALQKDQIQRKYLAWIVGHLEKPAHWTHLLQKNEKTNEVKVVSQGGKRCALSVRPLTLCLWKGHALTLAEYQLETGRSHQIRVQSSYEGYPLLGDFRYSKVGEVPIFPRVALHSCALEFPHPMTKEIMRFEEHLPKDLDLLHNPALEIPIK